MSEAACGAWPSNPGTVGLCRRVVEQVLPVAEGRSLGRARWDETRACVPPVPFINRITLLLHQRRLQECTGEMVGGRDSNQGEREREVAGEEGGI